MTIDKIHHVSQTQFSIARFYGGITINGAFYVYDPIEDSLTRQATTTKKKRTADRTNVASSEVQREMSDLFGE